MNNILKILIVVVFLIFVIQQIMSNNSSNNTETPEYRLVKSFENFEVREYPELILASTMMQGSYGENSSSGFRTVAGYIFGGNETSEKISMTAPVIVEMADTTKMSFIMPSNYSMSQLPKPNNSQVILHEEKSKVVAVIQYSGFSNDKKIEEYTEKLKQELSAQNLSPTGPFMYYGYNPPYQLTNRRNEVAVEIKWEN